MRTKKEEGWIVDITTDVWGGIRDIGFTKKKGGYETKEEAIEAFIKGWENNEGYVVFEEVE